MRDNKQTQPSLNMLYVRHPDLAAFFRPAVTIHLQKQMISCILLFIPVTHSSLKIPKVRGLRKVLISSMGTSTNPQYQKRGCEYVTRGVVDLSSYASVWICTAKFGMDLHKHALVSNSDVQPQYKAMHLRFRCIP